jgi:Xaa-Pro aminopeptidase
VTDTNESKANDRCDVYFQNDFPAEEFAARCGRVAEAIGSGVAVIAGAGAAGSFEVFRQTNDFYYLCGVEVPHAYLRIDGASGESTLYLPPRDPKHEKSEGATLNAGDVELGRKLTGVSDVRTHEALAGDLAGASIIYTPHAPAEGRQACRDVLRHAQKSIAADPWDGRPTGEERFRERIVSVCPNAEIRDVSPMLDRLRTIKSPREIDVMRRAGKLTALGISEAMRCTRPGLIEYQLAATADYINSIHGARGAGYRPIVACGSNIVNAHYYRNNCPLTGGELVLMDYAPDCNNYTSDIGRMWPVSGKYAPWQRELYGFIVEYHKVLLGLIRPGVTADQVMDEAAAEIEPLVESTAWSKPAFREAARQTLKFRGHLSHGVGMAVHDVGDYTKELLAEGVVFALDPQMWVPEEHLYIRVEDTVVVTADGVENLTSAAPLELNDVEQHMQQAGMIDLVDAGLQRTPGS